jgi:hypothetical protein
VNVVVLNKSRPTCPFSLGADMNPTRQNLFVSQNLSQLMRC